MSRLLTTGEVGRKLGLSRVQAWRLLKGHRLAVHIGGRYHLPETAVCTLQFGVRRGKGRPFKGVVER